MDQFPYLSKTDTTFNSGLSSINDITLYPNDVFQNGMSLPMNYLEWSQESSRSQSAVSSNRQTSASAEASDYTPQSSIDSISGGSIWRPSGDTSASSAHLFIQQQQQQQQQQQNIIPLQLHGQAEASFPPPFSLNPVFKTQIEDESIWQRRLRANTLPHQNVSASTFDNQIQQREADAWPSKRKTHPMEDAAMKVLLEQQSQFSLDETFKLLQYANQAANVNSALPSSMGGRERKDLITTARRPTQMPSGHTQWDAKAAAAHGFDPLIFEKQAEAKTVQPDALYTTQQSILPHPLESQTFLSSKPAPSDELNRKSNSADSTQNFARDENSKGSEGKRGKDQSSTTLLTSTTAITKSRPSSPSPSSSSTEGVENRFPCPVAGCDKDFSTSGHAKRHSRIHDAVRLFQCPYPHCSASFNRRDNCNQHQRSRHHTVLETVPNSKC